VLERKEESETFEKKLKPLEWAIWFSNLFILASNFLLHSGYCLNRKILTFCCRIAVTILHRTSLCTNDLGVFFYAIVPGNDAFWGQHIRVGFLLNKITYPLLFWFRRKKKKKLHYSMVSVV